MKKDLLPGLTGVRFFAALSVLCVHYVRYVFPAPAWLAKMTELGGSGVSLFFVLSGFILSYNYQGAFAGPLDRQKLAGFFRARFARVYPMHLIALLAITPLSLYLIHRSLAPASPSLLAAGWFSQAFLLNAWVPNMQFQFLFNSPSWSISAEAFFYLCFPPFMMYLNRRLRGRRELIAHAVALYIIELAAFVAVGVFFPRILSLSRHEALRVIAYYQPVTRVWEFLIGCVIGTLFISAPQRPPRWFANLGVLVSLGWVALAVAAKFAGIRESIYLDIGYIAMTPAFALLIFSLAAGGTFLSPILECGTIVLLGEASYALYLIHWAPKIILEHHFGSERTPVGIGIGAMAGCVLLSVVAMKWIEKPARDWLRHKRVSYPSSLAEVVVPNAEP